LSSDAPAEWRGVERRTDLQKSDSFIPFLAGLGVGVAATLLLAPADGRKTRNRIGDIASSAAGALKGLVRNLRETTENLVQEGIST
jgi:gas vesicle protein